MSKTYVNRRHTIGVIRPNEAQQVRLRAAAIAAYLNARRQGRAVSARNPRRKCAIGGRR